MKEKLLIFLAVFTFISTQALAWGGARTLYDKADKYYLKGDYENAAGYCEKLLRRFKSSNYRDDANFLAGLSLLKLSRYSQARKYFNNVINQRHKSSLFEDAYLGLADTYYLEKNYSKASEIYHEILMEFPDGEFRSIIKARLKKIGEPKKKTSKKSAYYTVQIGSFKKKYNARRLYRRFKKRKYSAYIVKSEERGKIFYKVRIGKFKSEKQAEVFAKKLKKEGYETKVTSW